MRRKSLALLVFTSSVSVAACSLFVDTSGLEGGNGASSEGGAFDASASDATGTDASTKDSGGVDAGLVFVCDANLCDDFDESSMFDAVWSTHPGTGGATNVVAKGLSIPNAFEPTMVVQSGQSSANLDTTFSASVASAAFRVEFDFFLPSGEPMADEADIVDIEAHGSIPNGDHLYVAKFGSKWSVAEFAELPDGGSIDHTQDTVVSPEAGVWNHFLMTSDGSTWTLSVNGIVAGSISVSPAAGETGISRTLHLGWTYVADNTVALDAYYDDVSMTFLP